LLAARGALGPRSCAVHATHLGAPDIELLGGEATCVCMCPTTERDLADGIGPAAQLTRAGSPLVLGSDSHAVIDLFEEARAVELDERLAIRRRGTFTAGELLLAACAGGHRALGWDGAGVLRAGAPADMVTVRLDSVRLAGVSIETMLESLLFAGSAADVSDVIVAGRPVVAGARHLLVGDVAAELSAAIDEVVG